MRASPSSFPATGGTMQAVSHEYAIRLPSGDQEGVEYASPIAPRFDGAVPFAFITQSRACVTFRALRMNAMLAPSGDQDGCESSAALSVIARMLLPVASTT